MTETRTSVGCSPKEAARKCRIIHGMTLSQSHSEDHIILKNARVTANYGVSTDLSLPNN